MERRSEGRRADRVILTVVLSAVVAVSSVIFLILLSFVLFLIQYSTVFSKVDGLSLRFFIYGGIIISAILLTISILSLFKNVKMLSAGYETPGGELRKDDLTDALKYLDEGEREILQILMDAGGSMLQRDIARSGNYSKATVTRILDRLESKGIVERLRHGTTNKIVLKKVSRRV
ncbi:MAG: helix-turn-helix transcriptional regulator [Thermoplasmata archaeon]